MAPDARIEHHPILATPARCQAAVDNNGLRGLALR
jgi:hypothetical protein